MAYCEAAGIRKKLDQNVIARITEDDGTGEEYTVDQIITEAIDDADDEIDIYVGKVAELPLSTVPPILEKLSVDIAIYNLYSRTMETVPEIRKTRYDRAIEILEMIAGGELSIGVQPPPDDPASYRGGSKINSRTKIYDSDKVDEIL